MSLTITSTIQTIEGFDVTNAYGRVAVVDNPAGVELEQLVELFSSEQAFLDGKAQLNAAAVITNCKAPYDRTVQGVDILDLAHDNLIVALAQQGVTATKNL